MAHRLHMSLRLMNRKLSHFILTKRQFISNITICTAHDMLMTGTGHCYQNVITTASEIPIADQNCFSKSKQLARKLQYSRAHCLNVPSSDNSWNDFQCHILQIIYITLHLAFTLSALYASPFTSHLAVISGELLQWFNHEFETQQKIFYFWQKTILVPTSVSMLWEHQYFPP